MKPVKNVALQLYTVRETLQQDPPGTLRRVYEAGYRWVETAPPPSGISVQQLAGWLKDSGLSVLAMHGEMPLVPIAGDILDQAALLKARRLIWHGWPKDPLCSSLEGYRRLADRYVEASIAAAGAGLEFGLHNHWWECEPLEGVIPLDWLHQSLPPGIFFELDVYWATVAGQDPVSLLERFGQRVRMVHLKDGPAVHGQPMTALGEGKVDIRRLVKSPHCPVDVVVELDECAEDPLEAAGRSRRTLSDWSQVAPPPLM